MIKSSQLSRLVSRERERERYIHMCIYIYACKFICTELSHELAVSSFLQLHPHVFHIAS